MTLRLAAGILLAVVAGIAVWAAHPPLGFGFLAYLVVPLLIASVDVVDGGPWTGIHAGVTAGLVGFLIILTWLIPPAGYLGWFLLAFVQAAWFAVTVAVITPFRRSLWVILVAPAAWTAMEAWRGLIPLTGFAWGELAYAHAGGSPLLPLARVIGARGVTFLTVLIGTLAYVALRRMTRSQDRAGLRFAGLATLGIVVLFGLTAFVPGPPDPERRTVDLLGVQGNDLATPPVVGSELDRMIARRMVDVTRRSIEEHGVPDLTVWPESSVDRDPWRPTGEDLLPFVEEAAELTGGQLLFGANLDGPQPRETFENSAILVNAQAEPLDRYVKRRYVPFGEYVPLRSVLERLVPALRQVPRDGVPGPGPQAVDAEAVDAAVVICFETLFPDIVRSNVLAADAGLVIAVTNDASFGRSAESDQHIAQSQLRAVETGRWVLHMALSGRSALIEPTGRVVRQTDVFERATIREHVPVVTASTPFLRWGDVVGATARWAGAALAVVAAAAGIVRRRTGPENGGSEEVG